MWATIQKFRICSIRTKALSWPRSVSTAGHLNPALLGLPGTPYWSVAFPQVAVGGTMLGTRFGDLQPMTKYRSVSDQERDEILARIHPDGADGRYDLRAPAAALQVGRFGVGITYTSVGRHNVGRDVMELLFDGYEEGRTDYEVGNTSGSRATFWDLSAAYGRAVGPVSIGATAHYYRGGTLLRSRMSEPRIDVLAQDIEVDYGSVMARGGSGYGLDLGAAYQPVRDVTLSASVSNVISSMTWSDEIRRRFVTLDRNDLENVSAMDLINRYEASESSIDPPGTSLAEIAAAEGLYDRTDLPSTMRLGAAWSGVTGTDVGLTYTEELVDTRLAGVWDRSVGIGAQQRIPFVTLRAGYATDLDRGSLLSGGLSLGVLQLGVARLNDGDLDGFDRSGWIGTFGVAVRTTGELR
jgi:hypothetical protein